MATKKATKAAAKPAAAPKARASAKPAAAARAPALAKPEPAKKVAGPTARTCPLVLDGEVDAADFSPSDCLTCSEFDCRFCEAEEGSGTLRSRLFASDDGADGDEEGFGGDFEFEGGGDEGLDDSGDDEPL